MIVQVIKGTAKVKIEYVIYYFLQALKDVGAGLTFRIATSPEIQTNADYRIPSTKYVTAILQWIQQHSFE